MADKNKVFYLDSKQIEQALSMTGRQYFSGILGKPQPNLPWFESELEIGMSYYDQFSIDTPHQHLNSAEHIYVVSGQYKIKLIDTNEEFELSTGSFLVLPPKTKYASKAAPNTRTFFIKSPGGNDKDTNFEISHAITNWLKSW